MRRTVATLALAALLSGCRSTPTVSEGYVQTDHAQVGYGSGHRSFFGKMFWSRSSDGESVAVEGGQQPVPEAYMAPTPDGGPVSYVIDRTQNPPCVTDYRGVQPPAAGGPEVIGKPPSPVVPGKALPTAPPDIPKRMPKAEPDNSSAAPASQPRICKSKRLVINYDVTDVGPSGVSAIELWYTRDTHAWQKIDLVPQADGPCVIEVAGEGLYGFTVVARNGVGQSKEPPRHGEQPQIWTEVDLTNPTVQLLGSEAAPGRPVTITWSANDRNLGPRPITLSYAAQPAGPWTTLAANLENTGRYEWKQPAGLPAQVYVRVEAIDQAGHVGADQGARPLVLDTARPNASIVAVEAEEAAAPVTGFAKANAAFEIPSVSVTTSAVYTAGQPAGAMAPTVNLEVPQPLPNSR